MAEYRLYFVDAKGTIQAREEFDAPDDDTALVVSDLLCRACSDVCEKYELWQGGRQVIAYDSPLTSADRIAALTDHQADCVQRIALSVGDSLTSGHWQIGRSDKLKEELKVLRARFQNLH